MAVLTADAVVVGGGHHGLVAAALLADAGWDVCLLEATDRVGGAVRSATLHPGFTADLFSAFYPLYAASPVLRALDLEAHGLRLVARPGGARPSPAPGRRSGRPCCTATGRRRRRGWPRSTRATARRGSSSAGSGTPSASRAAHALHDVPAGPRPGGAAARDRHGRRAAAGAVPAAAGPADGRGAVRAARARGCCSRATPRTPTRRSTPRSAAPTAGCWRCSGSSTGSRCRSGGAGELAAALARRAQAAGAALRTGQRVERIDVRGGRAVAVHTAAGLTVRVRRAVIADVNAPTLYRDAAAGRRRARRACVDDLDHFEWDTPVVKVNWALDRPIPWRAPDVGRAGHRAPGRGRARPGPVVGRPGVTDAAGVAVHAVRADDHGRPEPLAGGHRERVGLHAPAPRDRRRRVRRRARAPRRRDRRGVRPGVRRPGGAPARPAAGRPRVGRTPNLVVRRGQRRHGAAVPAAGVPAGAGPGPAETVVDNLYLGGSSAHPGGGCARHLRRASPPARRCATTAGWASRAAASSPPPSTCCTGVDRRVQTPRCTRHPNSCTDAR